MMDQAIIELLAFMLPVSFIIYSLGLVSLRKLKLSKASLIVGFFVAWVLSIVTALMIADGSSISSAQSSGVMAALIGSIITLIGLAFFGKRKA